MVASYDSTQPSSYASAQDLAFAQAQQYYQSFLHQEIDTMKQEEEKAVAVLERITSEAGVLKMQRSQSSSSDAFSLFGGERISTQLRAISSPSIGIRTREREPFSSTTDASSMMMNATFSSNNQLSSRLLTSGRHFPSYTVALALASAHRHTVSQSGASCTSAVPHYAEGQEEHGETSLLPDDRCTSGKDEAKSEKDVAEDVNTSFTTNNIESEDKASNTTAPCFSWEAPRRRRKGGKRKALSSPSLHAVTSKRPTVPEDATYTRATANERFSKPRSTNCLLSQPNRRAHSFSVKQSLGRTRHYRSRTTDTTTATYRANSFLEDHPQDVYTEHRKNDTRFATSTHTNSTAPYNSTNDPVNGSALEEARFYFQQLQEVDKASSMNYTERNTSCVITNTTSSSAPSAGDCFPQATHTTCALSLSASLAAGALNAS